MNTMSESKFEMPNTIELVFRKIYSKLGINVGVDINYILFKEFNPEYYINVIATLYNKDEPVIFMEESVFYATMVDIDDKFANGENILSIEIPNTAEQIANIDHYAVLQTIFAVFDAEKSAKLFDAEDNIPPTLEELRSMIIEYY